MRLYVRLERENQPIESDSFRMGLDVEKILFFDREVFGFLLSIHRFARWVVGKKQNIPQMLVKSVKTNKSIFLLSQRTIK